MVATEVPAHSIVGVPSAFAWRLHLRPREVDVSVSAVLLHVKLNAVLGGVTREVRMDSDWVREPCVATVMPVVLTRSNSHANSTTDGISQSAYQPASQAFIRWYCERCLAHHHQLVVKPKSAAVIAPQRELITGTGSAKVWKIEHSDPSSGKFI